MEAAPPVFRTAPPRPRDAQAAAGVRVHAAGWGEGVPTPTLVRLYARSCSRCARTRGRVYVHTLRGGLG